MLSTDEKQKPESDGITPMGRRIRARLDALGIMEREASRRAGFGLSYVGDVVHGRSKAPTAARLETLARVLECDLDYLIGNQSQPRLVKQKKSFTPVTPQTGESIRLIDLYASPLSDGPWGPMTREAVDKVPVIPPLLHVRDAYAYSVSNTHMEPRYYIGEVVYLNPGITARVGDFVFGKAKDGNCGVGRFAALEEGVARFTFLNSDRVVTYPVSEIDFIHRIVGSAG